MERLEFSIWNSSNGDLIKDKVWKIIAIEVNAIGSKKNVAGW